MNADAVILGNRRFLCLSPTLVRLEYAPDARFEDRQSVVAAAPRRPARFRAHEREGRWDVLDTGFMQIRAAEHLDPFNRLNLEIRWSDGRLMQFWRPGDRDHQNLGGALRSLDRYGGEAARLDGVHPSGMESPDPLATNWPAWIQCEVDPLYESLHPNPPADFNRGDWLGEARRERNDGRFLHRTFNWYKEARRFAPGLLSASGYFFLNDSESAVFDHEGFPVERQRPGCQDWYFFAYGRNYRQALADFRLLSGPGSLPPLKSLGIQFSRWPAFTEAEIADLVRSFAANGYPLSTIIMDMEWHKEGWGHWEFNPDLIPDPARFFASCREMGLDVVFNDHPLDVREDDEHFTAYVREAGPDVEIREREYNGKRVRMAKVDICDKRQNRAFCAVCHAPILKLGLDYWWNDGSRGQMIATSGQLVANQTFFEESERNGRRGMLLARYGGLGSHRYGAIFTGDANSDDEVLQLECEYTIRMGGVGVSLVSHDIGGFMLPKSQVRKNRKGVEIIDPIRYLRWLQFGVFSPILRFHSAPGCGSRRPDDYDEELGGACRRWLRVRHRLLPYLYTAAREHVDTGVPIVRGLFLDHPDDPRAYRFDEYYFGPALLVAPMLREAGEREIYLPAAPGTVGPCEGWWLFETAERQKGGLSLIRPVALDEVPVYVRPGTIIPGQDPDGPIHGGHVRHLVLDVYPGVCGEAFLYEDDGWSVRYRQGEFCRTRFRLAAAGEEMVLQGEVVEGRPLEAERTITVEIALSRPPAAVTDGQGKPLSWQAMATPGRYRIDAGRRDPSVPFAVRVKNSPESTRLEEPDLGVSSKEEA